MTGSILPRGYVDISPSSMTLFLNAVLKRFKDHNFRSTVGHRFLSDLNEYPTGDVRQFHYYTKVVLDFADPDKIPDFKDCNAILGEFDAGYDVHGNPWNDLPKTPEDQTLLKKLEKLADKGYPLVLIWPSVGHDGKDKLRLSPEQKADILAFTQGKFASGALP